MRAARGDLDVEVMRIVVARGPVLVASACDHEHDSQDVTHVRSSYSTRRGGAVWVHVRRQIRSITTPIASTSSSRSGAALPL